MYKNSSFVTTRNVYIKLFMEKYHLKIKSNLFFLFEKNKKLHLEKLKSFCLKIYNYYIN